MEDGSIVRMTVAEYLAAEEGNPVRHEFIGNEIHAMGPASQEHDKIAENIFATVRAGLAGDSWRIHRADTKVCFEVGAELLFYYPDVVVAGHVPEIERRYVRNPTLIVEVFSRASEVTDRRGKFIFYRRSPTLEEYVLVAEVRREVTVRRRADGWIPAVFSAPGAVVKFRSVRQSMTVAEIYAGVPSLRSTD